MPTILDDLIADHDRLRHLLALFERELQRCEQGEYADMQLMHDIARYYAEYFNQVHHPLEERLFEDLVRHGLPRTQDAAQASVEHAELLASTASLCARLDEVLHGQIVSRAALIHTGRRYVALNIAHMDHEEQTVFAWARDRQHAVDWRSVNRWRQGQAGRPRARYTALLKNEIDAYEPAMPTRALAAP